MLRYPGGKTRAINNCNEILEMYLDEKIIGYETDGLTE